MVEALHPKPNKVLADRRNALAPAISWMRSFILICCAILAVTAVGLALLLGFGQLGLGLHGSIALVLGVLLTMALAMGLMCLVFHSSRTGCDEQGHSAWSEAESSR
jgi:hypothetical protein